MATRRNITSNAIANWGIGNAIIPSGLADGYSIVHKFGNAPDYDTGDNEVTIWDGAEDDAVWELMNYVYSTSAAIDSISSTSASDTVNMEVQGLDANYDLTVQEATLNGTTRVALSTPLIRVFRAKNVGATDLVGHVIVYENDTTADDAGVPDDSNLIRAVVQPANNQTEMAIYTIPNGCTGYMHSFYAGTSGASKSTNTIIKIYARPFGQVFQLKHRSSLSSTGGAHFYHPYTVPQKFDEKTDIYVSAQVTAAGVTIASTAGGFDIVLIEN